MFQFLIGRLGTDELELLRDPDMPFQFLIGRLGTQPPRQGGVGVVGFQFLIGRLGTCHVARQMVLERGFNSS